MPTVTVKLYSALFKFHLKRRLETLTESPFSSTPFGITSRPSDAVASANPTFSSDGVATKDLHIDPLTSLSLRIFLPDSALSNSQKKNLDHGIYGGYSPAIDRHCRNCRKLPVILQFHGGGFVSGSNDAVSNDLFCRRIAKLLDAIVVAVGYRLAPENRYPAAFEDGVKVLNWLGKQANLAECIVGGDVRRFDVRRLQIVDGFGASMVEPWLAAHGDPSRYDTRRVKMEQFFFAEEIKNIVSCEGPARVERHERLDQWRRRMSRAGFQQSPIKMLSQAKQWLGEINVCEGYTVVEEKGCLVLGWKSKPIVAASCWKCFYSF